LDYTQFKDGRLKIITKRDVFFHQNYGDAQSASEDRVTRSVTIPIKMNDVLRYENNAAVLPENVRYHVIIVCDNGNSGSQVSSVVGAVVTAPDTGISYQMYSRLWYVDN
jgi:hypothetical protein